MEEQSVTFTWMEFFEELADKVLSFRNKQKDLLESLRGTGVFESGINEKDKDGNDYPMDEADPFTFFSLIMKFGTHKRKQIFDSLKKQFHIKSEVPQDFNGVPSSPPLAAWLITGKTERQPSDIDTLWDLFECALNNTITDELFKKALNVKKVGFAKLSQGLFRIRPNIYFPIDAQTEPFLKKYAIDFNCKKTRSFSDYQNCLTAIKTQFPDNSFYELSYQAWSENQSVQSNDTRPGWLRTAIEKYCSPERIKYREMRENQLIEILEEKDCQLSHEDWNLFFKIINQDYWNGKEYNQRFGQAFTGNNTKLMLKDIDKLNKWTKDIWNCDEENLSDVLKEFWNDGVKGAGIGFPTMVLYLLDDEKYNIWLRPTHENFKRVEDIPFSTKNVESYFNYNSKLVAFRTQNNLAPQMLDIIFSLDDGGNQMNQKTTISNNNMALNQILYGPPGTGKTYQTINYALSIIENKSLDEINKEEIDFGRESLLTRFKQYKDNDQVEFITFHQNYAYEDFIQGLRPNTQSGGGTLSFELNDGIFKLIADKALENYKASKFIEETNSAKPPFRKVFDSYFKKMIEAEDDFALVKMKKAEFKITGIGDKSIYFEKQTGNSNHSLSISTLADMYEKEKYTLTTKGGLQAYYTPLLAILLAHAQTISMDSASEELKQYIIIIDEINRANISRVFGELITLIEDDKRFGGANEMTATLPSGEPFSVPPNLSIIGTMNTADKSIALIDIALRRRFEFVKIYPEKDLVIQEHQDVFEEMNKQIVKIKGPDFQIGHAYLMEKPDQTFNIKHIMNNKIIPLLYEYFMNDGDAVNEILNAAGAQTINRYGLWEFESFTNE